jgi:beta-galactosidase
MSWHGVLAAWRHPELSAIGREPQNAVSRTANIDGSLPDDVIDLDGIWDFQLFAHPEGAFGAADRAGTTGDVDGCRSIRVPGAWTMQGTHDLPQYTNISMPFPSAPPVVPQDNPTGLYRRSFFMPADWAGKRIVLSVGAAESVLHVRVNRAEIGVSKGSRLAAEFDVTRFVRPGENLLELVVVKWSDASFIEDQDQWWHGGITRSVRLYATNPVHLRDVRTIADYDPETGDGRLEVAVQVGSPDGVTPKGLTVRATLLRSDRTAVVSAEGVGEHACAESVRAPVTHRIRVDDLPAESTDLMALIPAGMNPFMLHTYRAAHFELAPDVQRLADTATAFMQPEPDGHARTSLLVEQVAPWTAETPVLHAVRVELMDAAGVVLDSAEHRVGFRRVQIVGRDLTVNGRRIWVQGVNRHEADAHTGRTLTRDQTARELANLKRWGFNAIRTSHYPNDPSFYDLADEYGFYVIDEADIEGHDWAWTLCDDPRYLGQFVDRVSRMVLREKNHACIVMWSLGNETGTGVNHDAAAGWVRGYDDTRPVHYEGAIVRDWFGGHRQTDVVCPMYPPVDAIVAYATNPAADRPLIMCEYSHAMGNSNGSFDEYWRTIRSIPGLQGGFIWELKDHGIDPDGNDRYRYGGDFGEQVHDGNFSIDGFLFPDGSPHPGLFEVRRVFSPVEVLSDGATARAGSVRLLNRQTFASLEALTIDAAVVSADSPAVAVMPTGVEIADSVGAAGPAVRLPVRADADESVDVVLPAAVVAALNEPDALALRLTVRTGVDQTWAPTGTELAVLEVRVADAGCAVGLSDDNRAAGAAIADAGFTIDSDGVLQHPVLASGPRLQFWRALTDNDKALYGQNRLGATSLREVVRALETVEQDGDTTTVQASYTTSTGHVVRETQRVRACAGRIRVEQTVVVPPTIIDVPRIGVEFALVPGFERVTWLGDGPHECYPDRRASALIGRWESSVEGLQTPYVRPQENGARTGVTELSLYDGCRTVDLSFAQPMLFTASHHSIADLETVGHVWELPRREETIVRADLAQRGLGTASVGPEPLSQFILGPGTYTWSWSLAVR